MMSTPAKDLYLKPGEVFLPHGNPARVITVLGSCVAVALHDARCGVTSLCHGVYPRRRESEAQRDPRYVEDAIGLMLQWHGGRGGLSGLVAKLFGGAAPLVGATSRAKSLDVGQLNVEAARRVLAAHQVPVVAADVGGRHGRRLVLLPASGTVHLSRLRATPAWQGATLQQGGAT